MGTGGACRRKKPKEPIVEVQQILSCNNLYGAKPELDGVIVLLLDNTHALPALEVERKVSNIVARLPPNGSYLDRAGAVLARAESASPAVG
jgi:hypothetical protein